MRCVSKMLVQTKDIGTARKKPMGWVCGGLMREEEARATTKGEEVEG